MVQKIIDYFSTRPEVAAVYLFGSYARNRQHQTSDVDIGILFEDVLCEKSAEKIDEYHKNLSRIIRKDIHLVVMNHAGEFLAKQIFSNGKCIHKKNRRSVSEYQMKMYSMIADFSYYQDMIRPGFVRKLMEKK
ncbi:MAG: nucleotidyltransferase domain-containing protein [Desulfobacterales bacterium]|nr:nucleotidyltransferase domain-containing protein [Desulfobacterales bacterium]